MYDTFSAWNWVYAALLHRPGLYIRGTYGPRSLVMPVQQTLHQDNLTEKVIFVQ
jgi:hypothetical protein